MILLLSPLLLLVSQAPEAPGASDGAGRWGVPGGRADQVAPGFEDVRWSAEAAAPQRPSRPQFLSSSPAPPKGAGLEAWAGRVVVLLQLPNDRGGAEQLDFLGTIQEANADRGLVAVVLLPGPDEESVDLPEDERGEDTPGGTVSDSVEASSAGSDGGGGFAPIRPGLKTGLVPEGCPWSPAGGTRALVMGPSGELLGSCELPGEEDEVLELFSRALLRYPAPRLKSPLPEELADAGALYFGGEWSKARKAAAKVAKRMARKAPDVAARGDALVRVIDGFERDLFVAFTEAEGGGYSSMERLANIAAAAQRGFPRSKLAKFAKETPDRLGRAGALSGFSSISSWVLASEYVELLEDRPPLFPVVVDSKAKRFAKELSGLLTRTSSYGGGLTRRIQSLLTRHEAAKATR